MPTCVHLSRDLYNLSPTILLSSEGVFQNNSQIVILEDRKLEAKVKEEKKKSELKNRLSCFTQAVAKHRVWKQVSQEYVKPSNINAAYVHKESAPVLPISHSHKSGSRKPRDVKTQYMQRLFVKFAFEIYT